ncbi:MAG: LPS export ABC transporter permease LptF [Deltaproteobacteria bacterium]|nr:LPS export ABC transporter permease LptF [Deltaproteobacteria bacterium]
MRKIIDRYIFKEIAFPFILILCVLTFVLLMGKILQIMDLFINKGVSIFSIAKIFIFMLPYFMLFTIPIALLISILIAIGRLSSDNEITALKTSGVSMARIYYRVAVASLLAFVFTLLVSYFVAPQSNFATKRLLFDIAQQNASVGIKEKVFNDSFKGFIIYTNKISEGNHALEEVIVSDKRTIGEQNTIIAPRAFLVSDPDTMRVKLRMENGSIHTVSSDLKNYRKIDFQSYEINLDLYAALAEFDKASKAAKDMTMTELLQNMKKPGMSEKDVRELSIEAHKKFSIPLACIFFGLLALPLGMRSQRSVKARGFAVGLITVCLYYLLRIGGEALAETGYIPVAVGVWIPNISFAFIGIFMFYITSKEIYLF